MIHRLFRRFLNARIWLNYERGVNIFLLYWPGALVKAVCLETIRKRLDLKLLLFQLNREGLGFYNYMGAFNVSWLRRSRLFLYGGQDLDICGFWHSASICRWNRGVILVAVITRRRRLCFERQESELREVWEKVIKTVWQRHSYLSFVHLPPFWNAAMTRWTVSDWSLLFLFEIAPLPRFIGYYRSCNETLSSSLFEEIMTTKRIWGRPWSLIWHQNPRHSPATNWYSVRSSLGDQRGKVVYMSLIFNSVEECLVLHDGWASKDEGWPKIKFQKCLR